jgi:uncharacterized protein (TIGR01777 family)
MDDNRNSSNDKVPSVLITGGSGLIGRYLTGILLDKGFKVSHLSRKPDRKNKVQTFRWDPDKSFIETDALEGTDCIIHLAGANIGEKPWTEARRDEIIRSRVDSARLLHEIITYTGVPLSTFISASAVGYYGAVTSGKIFNEEDTAGTDFLGITCRRWEEAADLFEKSGIRTVKIRTAVVLEKTDSALSKLMMPGKLGFLVKTGNGKQYMPWIHIDDLCGIYLRAVTDTRMRGSYNAVAPQQVTHAEFMKTLGEVIKRPVLKVPVPSILLKALMGQMSDVILKGSRVSPEKIIEAGYKFKFSNLHDALNDAIYNNQQMKQG